ncbi:MAG: extracellular solute-binding protein [Pseudobutyrivibrio sp.]|nr:extracellular solute-binding protein [Pseudobutyrivibrio sp.]
MKKKLVVSLLSISMVASLLVGCGASEQASTETTAAAESKPEEATEATVENDPVANLIAATEGTVELTLWCDETPEYQAVMAENVEKFKAEYSDVDFNITIGAESVVNCKEDVLKDPEAAADVFVFADDQLNEMVTAGVLQSVDTTFTYDIKAANAPLTIEAATVNDKLYAYPMTASNGYFLYYDKNQLTEDDVASWDNLLAAAEKLDKTVGMEVSGSWYMYGFFAGAGLDMTLGEDGKNVCNWNATDTKFTGADVATAITEICEKKAMVNCVNDEMQAFAKDGKMIAVVNGTWSTSNFQEAYGDGYAATKLPTFTCKGEQVQMGSFAGFKFMGVNSYSKNTGWAMLLAEYLTNENSQVAIGMATGEGPANITAAATPDIAALPALQALCAQAEFADVQRVGGNYWDPAGTLGKKLVEGDYTDVQALLDEAVAGITE